MKLLKNPSSLNIPYGKKVNCTNTKTDIKRIISEEFSKPKEVCPYCSSSHIIKHGCFGHGKQRYRCKACNKTFSEVTNAIISYSKKSYEKWIEYLTCMDKGLTIRSSAARIKISSSTAFYWRHKILRALREELPGKLTGIIEVKTTYIDESFKGKRYPVFKESKSKTGEDNNDFMNIKDRRICVVSCCDRSGNIFSKALCRGSINYKKVEEALSNRIPDNSMMCVDNNMAYVSFAKIHKLSYVKIKYRNEIVNGRFNLKNSNSFEHSLRKIISRSRGVCTRYLNFYIAWVAWIMKVKDYDICETFKMIIANRNKLKTSELRMIGELG